MKFQNPSLKFFFNGWTNEQTDGQAVSSMPPHFFKVGGIKSGDTVFPIITLSVTMETSGQI